VTSYLRKGWPHPLAGLKRQTVGEKHQTRPRRPATPAERGALFSAQVPWGRQMAYALSMYNGLRREEVARLPLDCIDESHGVPLITIPPKMGAATDGKPDILIVHPFVHGLMKHRPQDLNSGSTLLPAVPDNKTIKRDLERGGCEYADSRGRILPFHALRHTFITELGKLPVPRAVRLRLGRHGKRDVHDGYDHAEPQAQREALLLLPLPSGIERDMPVNEPAAMAPVPADHWTPTGQKPAPACPKVAHLGANADLAQERLKALKKQVLDAVWHELSQLDLSAAPTAHIVSESGPGTQADYPDDAEKLLSALVAAVFPAGLGALSTPVRHGVGLGWLDLAVMALVKLISEPGLGELMQQLLSAVETLVSRDDGDR
jgi:hypothetical protein